MNSRDKFLETTYMCYAHKLENICLQYTNYQYRDIVADSIQKTFEQATRQYKELKDSPYLEGWLVQTCYNRLTTALKTHRRRMKRQVSLDDDKAFVLPPEQIRDAVDEVLTRMIHRELIEKIFAALNDRERDIAQRHFVKGIPVDEIACEDSTTIGAVKAVLARIRTKARKVGKKKLHDIFIIFVSFLQIIRFKK